ncbi:MAG: 4'-phosphopantetheinyl transferase superfamily protein [Henriciella sp.]
MTEPVRIDYWIIPAISPSGTAQPFTPTLEEQARADRYVKAEHGRRYLRARHALRRVLSIETGIPVHDLDLTTGIDGKPELADPSQPAHFNISHSGDAILIGVCHQARLALEIELIAPIEKNLVERFLSPAEQAALARVPEAQWLRGFYRCWTRKEAFVKGLGRGLKLPLDEFDVSIGDMPQLLHASFADPADWSLCSPEVPPSYEAAIAVEATGRRLELRLRPAGEAEPTVPMPSA